ncbi:hypothetical protein [Actinocrispum sp. NPDC049592]|uniref:hypothetical protein n=1 Tax=Actinocrispum sp. NPDC049592 TaxID=3154835 RepID=UPI003417BE29
MVCPHCGSVAHKVIAPGFHECLGWRTEMFPDPATGQMVGRTIMCGQRYHAGDGKEHRGICACGTFAVGICMSCRIFVCGDHSTGGERRICLACAEAAQVAAEQEKQRQIAEETAQREAELARVRAVADPVERLLCAARFHSPPRQPRQHNPWGRASSVDSYADGHRRYLQEILVAVCPELWPNGHDGDPPWHTPRLGSWFVRRASAAGMTPPLDLVPLVRRGLFTRRDDLVRGKPQPAWHLPEGSTTPLSHVVSQESMRYQDEDWADAYILPSGRAVLHPYPRYGTDLHTTFLSVQGLAAMAGLLGLTW